VKRLDSLAGSCGDSRPFDFALGRLSRYPAAQVYRAAPPRGKPRRKPREVFLQQRCG